MVIMCVLECAPNKFHILIDKNWFGGPRRLYIPTAVDSPWLQNRSFAGVILTHYPWGIQLVVSHMRAPESRTQQFAQHERINPSGQQEQLWYQLGHLEHVTTVHCVPKPYPLESHIPMRSSLIVDSCIRAVANGNDHMC